MAAAIMNTFSELCVKHNCDKGLLPDGVGHGYCRHYASVLDPLRDRPIRLLEIGVGDGKSIKVWLDYFRHPKTEIIGVDNSAAYPGYPNHHDKRYVLLHADQSNANDMHTIASGTGARYDVIVDDGSHMSNGIITSFEACWPFLRSGGYYFIEDLRCSYMPGYSVPGWPSQMHFIKGLLDDINAQTNYKPAPDSVFNYPHGTDGSRGIEWFRFSEELCILKKK